MDLSSQKIKSISRTGLPNLKRNEFFFLGGGGRFWILMLLSRLGGVPKKCAKNVSPSFIG